MTDNIPIKMLARLDDVAVFQTSAFVQGNDTEPFKKQQQNQKAQASYSDFNLGLHVDDEATVVLDNRMRLLAAINEQLGSCDGSQPHLAAIQRVHWVNQVHGKQVHTIDATRLQMRPCDADAMCSQQSGVGLAIMTADCVPIVLYQHASGQIAAIHAGWQGLACAIIQATVERFSADGEIKAWLGCCISQAHYEVGVDVRNKLLAGCIDNQSLTASQLQRFDDLFVMPVHPSHNAEALHKTVEKVSNSTTLGANELSVDKSPDLKVKLNLPKLAILQLEALGIEVANNDSKSIHCSYADTSFYSYRRQTHLQQPATGRMALIIARTSDNRHH